MIPTAKQINSPGAQTVLVAKLHINSLIFRHHRNVWKKLKSIWKCS